MKNHEEKDAKEEYIELSKEEFEAWWQLVLSAGRVLRKKKKE